MGTFRFELKRQSIHFLGIVFVILSYFLNYWAILMLLLLALTLAGIHSTIRPKLKKIKGVKKASDFLAGMARRGEKGKVYWGAATLFIGLIVILLISSSNMAIFRTAALVILLGDSTSTIIGRKFGKHKLPYNRKKTMEGSTAFFVFAFIGALTQVSIPLALLAAALGALLESLPLKVNDNLSIPIIVGMVIWWIL